MKLPLRWTKSTLFFGGIAVWGLLMVSCVSVNRTVMAPPKVPGAQYTGSKACADCHEGITTQFHDTTHSHLVASSAKPPELGCESCHGPASEHVRSGGEDGTIVNNAQLCASCHQDVQARFNMTSHHPVTEGIVGCISCHDAHGSKQATLTSTNARCTSCHQEVRGPHVFEHVPAAENCTNCHNPHGSPMRKMLVAAEPMLCLQCHSLANIRHSQTAASSNGSAISGAALRQCSSCHSQIHGSSQDEHLRY